MSYHKLPQKLNQLFLLASSPSTSKQSLLQALESFKQVKTEGMKHAESKCCHCNMGALQFSPELILWLKCHLLWQLVLCCQMNYNIKAHYICPLVCSCNIVDPLGLSAPQARAAYQAADLKYSMLKQNMLSFILSFSHPGLLTHLSQRNITRPLLIYCHLRLSETPIAIFVQFRTYWQGRASLQ